MTAEQLTSMAVRPLSEWTEQEIQFYVAEGGKEAVEAHLYTPEFWAANRERQKARYHNPVNVGGLLDHGKHGKNGGRKTVCTTTVLGFFGIHESTYKYSGHANQMKAILNRNGWSVRSRRSALGRNKSVAQIRQRIRQLGEPGYYMVFVDRHVLLLNSQGETVVDTDPRKADRRKVLKVYSVTRPENR